MRRTTPTALIAVALSSAGLVLLAGEPQERERAARETNTVVLRGTAELPVAFDGNVSRFEYQDAQHMQFRNAHGMVDVHVKAWQGHLYFAFELPDPTVHRGDDIVIMLDTGDARAAAPDTGCIRAYVRRKSENSRMHKGNGGKWADTYGEWEYRSQSYRAGWEVECRIPLGKLPAGPQKAGRIGLALRIWDNDPLGKSNWPAGSDEDAPASWGVLTFEPADNG